MKSFGDWGGFFAKIAPERMAWLSEEFGVAPDSPVNSVRELSDEAYGRLTDLRASVEDLARPDSYVLSDILAELTSAHPSGTSAEDVAVWLAKEHPRDFHDALEMLDYDRSFGRDAFWTGVEVKSGIRITSLTGDNEALKAALAACLQEPNRPAPAIILHAFSRASPRSGERGVHLTISYGGPLQSHWTIKDNTRVLATFAPERVASIVIDPETRTIDVVSREASKTLRSKLVAALLPQLDAEGATTSRITPRIVSLDSLSDRRSFPIMPEDGLENVRFVGAKLYRRPYGDLSLDARVSDAADVWDAWDGWTGLGSSFGDASIRSATLEFAFPPKGKGKPRRRVLRLYGTSGIVRRGWSSNHSEIAENLLMRWGLLARPGAA